MPVSLCEWRIRIGRFIPRTVKDDKKGCTHIYHSRTQRKKRSRPKVSQENDRKKESHESRTSGNVVVLISVTLLTLAFVLSCMGAGIVSNVSSTGDLFDTRSVRWSILNSPIWLIHTISESRTNLLFEYSVEKTSRLNSCCFTIQSVPPSYDTSPIILPSNQTTSDVSSGLHSRGAASCSNTSMFAANESSTYGLAIQHEAVSQNSYFTSCLRLTKCLGRCLWRLFIFRLHLVRAGDIETNPAPQTDPLTGSQSQGARSKVLDTRHTASTYTLSERTIMVLAREVPHDKLHALGKELGKSWTEVNNILEKYRNDSIRTATEILMAWKGEHGTGPEEADKLMIIFNSVGLGLLSQRLTDEINKLESPTLLHDTASKRISANLTVRECQQMLIEHYKRTARIQLQPGMARKTVRFEDLHTKIRLHKKRWTDKGQSILKDVLEGSIDDIFETEVDGEFPPRIVLLGAPGCGKTTSLAKLAHDWAVNEDSPLRRRFTLLFWLKFREMKRECSLGEAIVIKLLHQFKDITKEEMEKFISENGGQCCVLLDGYDEFGLTIDSPDCSTSVVDLLLHHKFPKCRVVVSSRPNLASHFETDALSKVYAVMELEEFGEDERNQYIDKFFVNDAQKGRFLVEFLKTKYYLASLLRIPFFCMVFCILWEDDHDGRLSNVETTSTLMNCFLEYLAAHAKAKQASLGVALDFSSKHLKSVVVAIGRVAFETLIIDQDKLVINKDEFDGCKPEFDIAVALGLLHTFDKETKNILEPSVTFSEFYHKLAQEHCAAVYLSSLSQFELEQKLSLINSKGMVAAFEHVLRFAAESVPKSFEPFIRLISRYKPNSEYESHANIVHTLMLDVAGISSTCGRNTNDRLLRSYFNVNFISITKASKSTIVGIENLPRENKNQVMFLCLMQNISTRKTSILD